MKEKPFVIALDIGNVCVKIDYANFAAIFPCASIPQEAAELLRLFECGSCDEEFFFSSLEKLTAPGISRRACREAFDAVLTEPVENMAELINSLPDYGAKAYFFSDISPVHLERTRALFPAAANIPQGMFSFVAGAQKPSAQMLGAFEKEFGVPDLYVDDRLELITAAGLRPWRAWQFAGANALAGLLKELTGK